jgi:hypothetical protein
MTRATLRPAAALAALTVMAALAGCYNPFSPRIAPVLGNSTPAPVPSSAPNLLRLFEWCYNNQAIAEYREIFTDDYRFFFSPVDSAGAEWRGTPYTREDEMISATNLFVGGSATEPPATSIRLSLDRNFFVYPDPDYTDWDPTGIWHKNIRTTVTLVINTDDGASTEITGHANFYMVRGDSAVIPEELRLRGFGPDPNRWYIRRWNDETAQEGGLMAAQWRPSAAPVGAAPAGSATAGATRPGSGQLQGATDFNTASWGSIKNYYRFLPPFASSARATPTRAAAP